MGTDSENTDSRACPDAGQLSDFLRDSLDPDDQAILLSHVESCDSCLSTIDALAKTTSPQDTVAPQNSDRRVTTSDQSELGFLERVKALPPNDTAWRHGLRPAPVGGDNGSDWQRLLSPPRAQGELGWIGSYRVLSVLGQGGMGVVCHAEDSELQRPVALKVMRPSTAESPAARERMLREARATAAIRHDNVVTIYQVGEHSGTPFIAMELLEGETLECRLRRGEVFDVPDLIRMAHEITLGLQAAHERGLIHRDIKPANIWIESANGRIKVLDFGLARREADPRLTHSGTLIGTPAYMSPEQADGQAADVRSDLFSMGAVLYRAATCTAAFPGETPLAVLSSLASHVPTPAGRLNNDLPRPLSDLIMQLLEKDPDRRPRSAAEVLAKLDGVRGGDRMERDTLPVGRDDSASRLAARPTARRRRAVAVGTAIAVVGAALLTHQTIIRIRDRDGTVVSEIIVPAGNTVEVIRPRKLLPDESLTPFDRLTRSDIPAYELAVAGGGDATRAPPELVAIFGDSRLTHGDEVEEVVWHPDGRWLASASRDGTVRFWDPATGQATNIVRLENSRQVRSIALNAAGTRMAIGACLDGTVVVRDLEKGREIFRQNVPDDPEKWLVDSVAFNSDETLIAAACNLYYPAPGIVLVWEVETGRLLRRLAGHSAPVRRVAFGTDGKRLYSVTGARDFRNQGGDGQLIAWDVDRGEQAESVPYDAGAVVNFGLSPDGTRLALCGRDGVAIRDAVSLASITTIESDRPVTAVSFDCAGARLATIGVGTSVQVEVYEVDSGALLTRYFPHRWRTGTCVAFRPDGHSLASAATDHTVSIRNLSTGKPVFDPRPGAGGTTGIAIAPEQARLAVCRSDTSLHVIDVAEPHRHRCLSDPSHRYENFVAFFPGGNWLVTGGTSLNAVNATDGSRNTYESKLSALDGAFSPDGRWLAVANTSPWRTEILVYDADSGDEAFRLKGHKDYVYCVAFSPDGTRLASGSDERTQTGRAIRIWDCETRESIRVLSAAEGPARDIAWSPDGLRLASASGGLREHFVTVRDAKTGTQQHRFGPFRGYTRIAFSSDSRYLAAADRTGRLVLYDPETGETTHEWHLKNCLLGVVFGPDSRHVVTANGNGTVSVFRLTDTAARPE